MKLVRFNQNRIGVVDGGTVRDVSEAAGIDPSSWPPVGMVQLIRDFPRRREAIEQAFVQARSVPLAEVTLTTPIPWPNKLIAFPVNYSAHGKEMESNSRADTQGFFLKANTSLSGASEPITIPDLPGKAFHHECELAIIIGSGGRHISRANALKHVFGYSCLVDVTVRGKQERVMRKSFDSFCPVGPWIVTADEIEDSGNLTMQLWVNDDLRQNANTRDLILDIPGMIEMASSVMTLEPGDIIATGTPEGVGPIVPGDVVTIEIERVGRMTLNVVQGKGGMNSAFANQ